MIKPKRKYTSARGLARPIRVPDPKPDWWDNWFAAKVRQHKAAVAEGVAISQAIDARRKAARSIYRKKEIVV